MKIGILSDTHNELENVNKAASVYDSLGIDTVIHCGDLTTPRILMPLKSSRVYLAFGNTDIDRELIAITLRQYGEKNQAESFLDFVLFQRRIFVIHGDDSYRLNKAIKSGDYDYIFTGHTHRRRDERLGKTRIINPGALGGTFYEQRSFSYLDLETDQLSYFYL